MTQIKKLTSQIIKFRDSRDWKKFHNPKDMALSLVLEASELLEHFQWKNGKELEAYVSGLCGSGITADEKFKKQKNGNTHRHVYYGCTKVRDKECECGYINEIELIKQFEELVEKIDIDEIGIKEKIRAEVERFKKFQNVVLGIRAKIKIKDIDIRNYAKYLLGEGTIMEKRELLGCLKSRIFLKNKSVYLRS